MGTGKPKHARHIPALDGIRGLAVLIVFVFHYGGGTHSSVRAMQIFGSVNKGGWAGVVLFFVLSGFLITGILWDGYGDPGWWRKFFVRRSLRIVPLYYITLLLVVVAAIPVGVVRHVLAAMWVPALFLSNMPYLSAMVDRMGGPLPIFHLWSIAVEEQFYLVWPFLLVWQKTRERARTLCAVTFLVSAVFRVLVWQFAAEPALWEHFLLTQAGGLAAGGWLALTWRGPEWARTLRLAPVAGFIGLSGFALTGWHAHTFAAVSRSMMVFGLPAVTLLFAAVLAFALEPGPVARLFSANWLRWLGGISYGVYVFHMLLLGPIEWLTAHIAAGRGQAAVTVVRFCVAAALSLTAALLSYHLFEKRFLKLKHAFLPRPSLAGELISVQAESGPERARNVPSV